MLEIVFFRERESFDDRLSNRSLAGGHAGERDLAHVNVRERESPAGTDPFLPGPARVTSNNASKFRTNRASSTAGADRPTHSHRFARSIGRRSGRLIPPAESSAARIRAVATTHDHRFDADTGRGDRLTASLVAILAILAGGIPSAIAVAVANCGNGSC